MLFINQGETGFVPVGYSSTEQQTAANQWFLSGANSGQATNGLSDNGFIMSWPHPPAEVQVTVPGNANPGACDLKVQSPGATAQQVRYYTGQFQVNGTSSKGPTCEPCKTAPKGDQAPDCGCKGEGKALAY